MIIRLYREKGQMVRVVLPEMMVTEEMVAQTGWEYSIMILAHGGHSMEKMEVMERTAVEGVGEPAEVDMM
jgi:hypothetical protein